MRGRTLERVRKLLAKAERTDNEHERAAFMAAASALMAKYGIDSLDPERPRQAPGDRIVTVPGPWAREKARLVSLVAQALRCRPLLIGRGDGGHRVHVFGFTADLERAELLATSLLLQMATGLARVRPPDRRRLRAYRRSWLLGFTDEVYRLLREAETARRGAGARGGHRARPRGPARGGRAGGGGGLPAHPAQRAPHQRQRLRRRRGGGPPSRPRPHPRPPPRPPRTHLKAAGGKHATRPSTQDHRCRPRALSARGVRTGLGPQPRVGRRPG